MYLSSFHFSERCEHAFDAVFQNDYLRRKGGICILLDAFLPKEALYSPFSLVALFPFNYPFIHIPHLISHITPYVRPSIYSFIYPCNPRFISSRRF